MRRFGAHEFTADDRHLVVYANQTIRGWGLPDQRAWQFDTDRLDDELVGLSLDGRYVATGARGTHREARVPLVHMWDLDEGARALKFDFPALWLAFDPTGPRCAVVGKQELRLFEQLRG
jgi:dipeptidyl aminopeptidase/acylaminoacyl peptidase